MAADVVRMVIRCGLVNNSVAFRNPIPDTSSFEEKVLNKTTGSARFGKVGHTLGISTAVSPRDV